MSFEQAVIALIKKHEKMIITSGVVKAVRDDDCDISREGLPDLLEVRFKSVLNATDSEFKVIPKQGSTVLCGIIESDPAEAVIISCAEIDKVSVKIDELEFVCESAGVRVTNQGENLKAVLNEFQDKFGALCDQVNSIVVSIGTSPNVPAISQIKQDVTVDNKNKLNKILIE